MIVPIRYDGEDLAQVAELLGLSVTDVIRKHHQSVWNVAFIGFAPGFAYMSSPDKPFTDIPRLTVPRKKIPSGSLGLAGKYSGIYPKDSPGGWQLIGTTLEKMWDLERKNPALLLPGMTVHLKMLRIVQLLCLYRSKLLVRLSRNNLCHYLRSLRQVYRCLFKTKDA